jgi:hypothetical protein
MIDANTCQWKEIRTALVTFKISYPATRLFFIKMLGKYAKKMQSEMAF